MDFILKLIGKIFSDSVDIKFKVMDYVNLTKELIFFISTGFIFGHDIQSNSVQIFLFFLIVGIGGYYLMDKFVDHANRVEKSNELNSIV